MGRYNKHTTYTIMQHGTVYNEHEQENFTQLKTNQTQRLFKHTKHLWA